LKILLDANFIINLGKISCGGILRDVSQRNGWDIILPSRVHAEVIAGGRLDNTILDGIQKVSISTANSTTLNRFMNMYSNLGGGELEAISIAHDSGALSQYLILSDDNLATRIANKLGIQSLGISTFMILANQQGLLSKRKAIQYMNTLNKNQFSLKKEIYDRFRLSLV
jgi:predicted nucleic acid-binding protein